MNATLLEKRWANRVMSQVERDAIIADYLLAKNDIQGYVIDAICQRSTQDQMRDLVEAFAAGNAQAVGDLIRRWIREDCEKHALGEQR